MRLILVLVAIVWAGAGLSQQVPQSAAQMQLSFVPLVRQATPAVVNIYARIIRPGRSSPFEGDPFFERFFRDSFREQPRVQNSLGSGVILSRGGIVVSNYHVVGNATDIRVVLSDRREFSAQVLLSDAQSDLAILKLDEAADLPFLPLRAFETVEVGELVLAIGNPFGVGQTVSSGIVSGLARSGAATGSGRGYFIQTDAPINPGNSGGALIDMNGSLIGINTSILTRSGGSNGIGFAIPSDLVAAFVAQAEEGRESFARPWAGISGQPVDAEMAEAFGLYRPGGIIVSGIHAASPFATADVEVGDVIVSVNGRPVNTPSEMIYRMSVTGLGQEAVITRLRQGNASDTSVRMIEAPETPARDRTTLRAREVLEGLVLERVNPAVISEYNLPLEAEGVLVADTGRLGRRVGLLKGDVIMGVNEVAVAHPDEIRALLAERARRYELIVLRGARRIVLQFRV
ncbi:trypsin-like peptidase domain-containing protein [uncultured Roseobacter sp.]|uniref:trypsin-like peptidase domain-containing protein n=1 Tax=uncultured Roseobacter sp. TaxID=114847 RepID=UPI00262F4BA0|nr:trypsin-like peptidase domain-containing protein [uncultured Roseobacter sp.]